MSRWKYPFNTKAHAEKYLKQAEQETGKRCFIRQVSIRAHVFKIFSSETEYIEYQKKKSTGHGH